MSQNEYKKNLWSGYSLLILFTFCTLELHSQIAINNDTMNEHQKLVHDIFSELVEINTTSGKGSTKAAEAMAARLLSAGFQNRDIQVTGPDSLHKNLGARYRGKGKLSPVLFICHLDDECRSCRKCFTAECACHDQLQDASG